MSASNTPVIPKRESEEEFLERLIRVSKDWRYSDEFIGLLVRARWPRDYSDLDEDVPLTWRELVARNPKLVEATRRRRRGDA